MSNPAPIPNDFEIEGTGELRLRGRHWSVENSRGVVIVGHGLGEHGGSYSHVAEELGRNPRVDVVALDFRGHGRSEGPRGVVRRYDDLCDDYRSAVDWAKANRPDLARFALGHSNGGLVVLKCLLDGGLDVRGVILSNPALQVKSPIPRWKLKVGKILRRVAPRVTMESAIDLTTLTTDPVMIEDRRTDPLRHGRVNGPLFFGIVEGGEEVARRAEEITAPLLMLLGESDPIIDPEFSSEVYRRFSSTDKTLLTYAAMRHEPLNDLDRALPIAAVAGWLDERLGN